MVVSVSADAKTGEDDLVPVKTPEATRKNRWMSVQNATFVIFALGLLVFLFIGGVSGTLFAVNLWTSLVWWLPVALLVIPLGYLFFTPRTKIEPSLARTVFCFVTPLVLFIGLLILIGSRLALGAWGTVAGNAILGTPGWGLFAPLVAIGLPWLAVMLTMWSLLKKQFSLLLAVFCAIVTPVSFIYLLGWCIVVHRGW
jgi:hypothetical protein